MSYLLRLKNLILNTINNASYYYIILLIIFTIGTIVGPLLLKTFSNNTILGILKTTTPYMEIEHSGMVLFRKSLIINLIYVTINFLLGYASLGILCALFVLIRASTLGLLVGFMIQSSGMKGFLISVLAIYPIYLIYLPCIILIAGLSIIFSERTSPINQNRYRGSRLSLTNYVCFLIFIFFIMTIGSFYEGFISPWIFKFL